MSTQEVKGRAARDRPQKKDKKDKNQPEQQKDEGGDNETASPRSEKSPRSDEPNTPRSSKATSKGDNWVRVEVDKLKKDFEGTRAQIKKPPQKSHCPYVWNSLLPYTDTGVVEYALEADPYDPYGYCQRRTALGMTDPEVDWKMDNLLFLVDYKKFHEIHDEEEQEAQPEATAEKPDEEGEEIKNEETEKDEEVEDPTPEDYVHYRLPRFPVVKIPPPPIAKEKKSLNWMDVPTLREQIKGNVSNNSSHKIKADYSRTTEDWKRMELEKLSKMKMPNRFHLKESCLIYLGTTPGSKQAAEKQSRKISAN